MEVLFVSSPSGVQCMVCAAPVRVTVGVETESGHHIAAIKLEYDLPGLTAISPILLEMKKRETQPTIFIWDEECEIVQISVLFLVADPAHELVETVMQSQNVYGGVRSQCTCSRILTDGGVDIEKEGLQKFLAAFRQLQSVVVIVEEVEEGVLPDPATTHFFEAHTIKHQPLSSVL